MQLSTVALIILAIAASVLLYAFMVFDRIVRAEYANNKQAWEADGRPRGFFWSAPECTWARSAWATNRLSFVWLFRTPEWAAKSAACLGLFRRWRTCVIAWNIVVVGLLFLVVVSL